ncbi:MAG: amidohydrolase family protein [Pseudomonadota bacterium]
MTAARETGPHAEGTLRGHTLRGRFAHAPERGKVEILDDALLEIDDAGTIARVVASGAAAHAEVVEAAEREGRLHTFPSDITVLPGFIDLHIHAPQYPQAGLALDAPLEVWLQRYTFPLEARYADLAFARAVYTRLVRDLLSVGTTTALMFATVHTEATEILIDACLDAGLRAVVGKVAMDDPESCPADCRDASAEAAVAGTRRVIDYAARHPANAEGLVAGAITPRFLPSCTDEALQGLGALAAETGAVVQTHVSESDWQHGYAFTRFKRSDAESLDAFGLLTERSVLAHGVYLSDDDLALMRGCSASVAHCPHSNAYFANAVFPLARAMDKGVTVGLGSDISGGPNLSLLDAQRQAVMVSRMLADGVDPGASRQERATSQAAITWKEAFHCATAAGGDALKRPIGRFRAGQAFDAIAVRDPASGDGWPPLPEHGPEDVLARILYTAARDDIRQTFVAGRLTHAATG